jgi:hypothetical protein
MPRVEGPNRSQGAVGGRRSVAGADKYIRATVLFALMLFLAILLLG